VVAPRWLLLALVAILSHAAHAQVAERKLVVTPATAFTPRTLDAKISPYLYLNRCIGGCPITGGTTNDARMNQSSIPAPGSYTVGEFANVFGQTTTTATKGTCLAPDGTEAMPATTCTADGDCSTFGAGSICDTADYEWGQLVQCMTEVYSPYALTVTDTRPTDVSYTMAVIGGSHGDLGQAKGVLGIAPLAGDCSAQDNVISFSFANDHPAQQRIYNICWTASQESAHAFGLDHEFQFVDGTSACDDPMTYRVDCGGEKFFRNKNAQCGEYASRTCRCGGTQNSHTKLISVFGEGTSIIAAPTVAVTFPAPNKPVIANWNTIAEAGSKRGVGTVELWLNGYPWVTKPGAAFDVSGQKNPSTYSLVAPNGVPDGGINVTVKAFDDLDLEGEASIEVQKGASCVDDSTCLTGQHCNTGGAMTYVASGGCYWDPPAAQIGQSCTYPQFCVSAICEGAAGSEVCTQLCNPGTCPSGFECDSASDGKSYCFAAAAGCCSAGRGVPWGNLGGALFVLAIVLRRRRDKSC
jgi:hypothetical protein